MKKLLLLATPLLLAACSMGPRATATATLASTSGSSAQGTVTFRELRDGRVEVDIALTGVPAGTHGFHLHDKGDCGDNGNAAGGHWNPNSMPHGAPTSTSRHAGDLGNVTAGADGAVHETKVVTGVTVTAGTNSVVGHAVILHANADDLTTQPTGNAGARIACGVVAGSMQR
ncbi:MAG TPA: superoxide dismutase family protein [Thermoanaerobaculia bacterium]|jgi:Cu-Zn family superoxide dismutase